MASKASNTRNESGQQSKSVKVWFPVFVGDFFTVTASMTGHEVGAYQLILAALWKEGGSIPANDRQLAKLCKASPRQWKDIKETLWPLFEIKNGMLVHAATLAEIEKAQALSDKKQAAANARWAAKASADAMHVHSGRNAVGMPRAGDGEGEGSLSSNGVRASKGFDDSDGPFNVIPGGRQ